MLIILLILSKTALSQVAYNESFTPENFGSFADHPEWTLADEDGLDNYYAWMSDSWGIKVNGALASSKFTTSGTADNWMISPIISVPSNPYLNWTAWNYAYWADTEETYEIKISTTDTDIASFSLLETITESSTDHTLHYIDLSGYEGLDIYIAFRLTSTDQVGLCIGDLSVGQKNDLDIGCSNLNIQSRKYFHVDESVSISTTVTNYGDETINSFNLNWTVNGGTVQTHEVTGVSLNMMDQIVVTHDTSVAFGSPNVHNLEVWVDNPNGGIDPIDENNEISTNHYGLSQIPEKNVLIEEVTGTWCGYCPMGGYVLQSIIDTAENAIGASLHFGDIMEAEGMSGYDDAYINAYPSATFDREFFKEDGKAAFSRSDWGEKYLQRLAEISPASINVSTTYNSETRLLKIDLEGTFHTSIEEDEYRFNIYIIEDSVSGGSDYDQSNYFNDTDGNPFEGLGNPIENYQHMHVVRQSIGGSWGIESSISESIISDADFDYSYSVTLPETYDESNISVIGFIQHYSDNENDREILNSKEIHLSDAGHSDLSESQLANKILLFPNPALNYTKIVFDNIKDENITIEISTIDGKVLQSINNWNTTVNNTLNINLNNYTSGIYYVRVISETNHWTTRLVIQ